MEVLVKNTGNRSETEVVQLYIRDLAASVARPIKQLKGFQRVTLEAGCETKVIFQITEEMLRFTRADGTFGSEAGHFEVYTGNSSLTEEKAEFELIN